MIFSDDYVDKYSQFLFFARNCRNMFEARKKYKLEVQHKYKAVIEILSISKKPCTVSH